MFILFIYSIYMCIHICLYPLSWVSNTVSHCPLLWSYMCRAIKRADYPPHPLALHMLGWMSELEVSFLPAPEPYYYYYYLCSYVDSGCIYLCMYISMYVYVMHAGWSASGGALLLPRAAVGANWAAQLPAIVQCDWKNIWIREVSVYYCISLKCWCECGSNLISCNMWIIRSLATSGKKSEGKKKKSTAKDKKGKFQFSGVVEFLSQSNTLGANESSLESAQFAQSDAGPGPADLMVIHKRLILHDRVIWLLNLRKSQMRQFLTDIYAPGKFVNIDSFWLDKLMHAFGECDDWATLLKSSQTFRRKTHHS